MSSLPRPEARLENLVQKLQNQVNDLRSRQASVPIYASDPTDVSIRLWMLNDGRLRGRKADNTIVEYQTVTSGGSSSTEPPAAAEYVPSTRVYEADADWSDCWKSGGSSLYTFDPDNLYYGEWLSSNGEFKSMIHFPGLSALAPGPAGTRISSVHLRLSNVHTNLNSGISLRLGYHDNSTVPGTFTEVGEIGRIQVGKPTHDKWYQISNLVGTKAASSDLEGLTLNQNNATRAAYGYAAGVGSDKGNKPRLKIVYVK